MSFLETVERVRNLQTGVPTARASVGLEKWRRGESNPRPKVHPRAHLRA